MKIKVYHGGTEAIASPRTDAGRPNLDFGQGFYITDFRQQALDWAKHVSDRRKSPAVLNVYTLDRDAILINYRCKVFDAYDGEWLDFIVDSRLGKKPWIEFDYIEGGVANDRVIDTINLYMADLMTRDKALERLSEHRPNNQMCLINQEIIDKYLTSLMMEQMTNSDPMKSPIIQEIIMSNRIGAICMEIAKRMNVEPAKALEMFYGSQTCADLHDRQTRLYLYGDLYVADEFMREVNQGPEVRDLK